MQCIDKWKKKGSFSITGGEPLMNPEFLFQLLDYLENRNVDRIDLLTNGTLLTDNIIDKLKQYKKLRRLQLSLEGLRETNDKIRGLILTTRLWKPLIILKDMVWLSAL